MRSIGRHRYGGGVKLSEWLDEYWRLDLASVTRTVAEPKDDWAENELLAPADRVHDTRPRSRTGLRRAARGPADPHRARLCACDTR